MASKPKTWSKRMTELPYGKRITARLTNEIRRLENTVQMMESWPNDEHNIGKLKLDATNALGWLRNAQATAEKIPDDFKPSIRRPPRKLKVGDTVVITKRYFTDYGYDNIPLCEVLDIVGRRLRIVDEAGTVLLVARGHVTYKERDPE
jgi:hypothetical protein